MSATKTQTLGVLAAGLLALSATGCATGSVGVPFGQTDFLSKVFVDSSYRPNRVNFSTADGALVEIVGAGAVDPQAVASVLSLPGRFQQKPFEAISVGPEEREELNRFVLVFGAALGDDGNAACRGRATAATDEPVVLIAFCDGDERISEGRLFSATANAPTDPAFGRAIRVALGELLPSTDPNVRGEPRLLIRG